MAKPKKFYNIQAKSTKEVDIFIYGLFGYGWWDEENRDAYEFVQEFKACETKYDRINIRINSPGGIISEGLPIYNAIHSSKKEIHTYNDGIAYSMGAIVLLAAKPENTHGAKNCLTLLHNAIGGIRGNAQHFREAADNLDKYDDALITSLETRTGLTNEEIRAKWFDYQDHLFTAKEAADAKLLNIIEDQEANIPDGLKNMTPDQVFNMYVENARNQNTPGTIEKVGNWISTVLNFSPNNKPEDMELKELRDLYGLPEDATEEQVIEAAKKAKADLDELKNEKPAGEKPAGEKPEGEKPAEETDPKDEVIEKLEARIDALENADGADPSKVKKPKDEIDPVEEDKYLDEINDLADSYLN